MAVQIFTAKHENFRYNNNSGMNARIIVNNCWANSSGMHGGGPVDALIQWGVKLDSDETGFSQYSTTGPKTGVSSHDNWGRNTSDSDLTRYLENPDTHAHRYSGVPCEYYIADGEQFSIAHQNTGADNSNHYGMKQYNVMVITDSAGTVYNGTGEFNYTNNTGENVRLIMGFLKLSGSTLQHSNLLIYWGPSTAEQNSASSQEQRGIGKWCMVNNPLNNGGFATGNPERYYGPNEFWLAPGDFFSVSVRNSSQGQGTVGGYSFIVMPESGT